MTLGPVRVMEAGAVVMMCVIEVCCIMNIYIYIYIYISLGTLVPNSRDRQGKLWLPKKQKTALKTILQ